MDDSTLIPLAFTVILGPQLTVAILILTREKPITKSLAFILGISLGIVILTYIMHEFINYIHVPNKPHWTQWALKIGLSLLILYLAFEAYKKRNDLTKEPSWMKTLNKSGPRILFLMGIGMVLFFPADIGAAINLAGILVNKNLNFSSAIPFFVFVFILISSPLCLYLLTGKKGPKIMSKVNHWINGNGWIINECVYLLFLALIWF